MCLIAMAWGVSAQYPLVIASNRDEFYARPTAPLADWTTQQGHTIYSGRDLRDGGTWLGFAQGGRFAMLTNVRNPGAPVPAAARSRGALVMDWLTSPHDAVLWCHALNPSAYAGFNLIIGDWTRQECHYVSNQHLTGRGKGLIENMLLAKENIAGNATYSIANCLPVPIQAGQIVGLSNAALNTPWPKTVHLVDALGKALGHGLALADLQEALQSALLDEQLAPVDRLPHTGVPAQQELALSSVFVRYPVDQPAYGTRTSLVAALSATQRLHLLETTHATPQQRSGNVSLSLDWPLQ